MRNCATFFDKNILENMSAPTLIFAFFLPCTQQQKGTLPPKAINPERAKVMKDALSWMTFRKDGNLAADQDLEPFYESLKMHYGRSKYFRTLIVAFKDGVLPRLTLNENDGCDPAYSVEYRDLYNNSVTYAQLKKFTFKYFDSRNQNRNKFCDYRQGLVCNQQSKKCECPKGSKMGQISEGSSEQRCQMDEDEICALIDLDHDPRSKYGALKKVLPEMLFNLEKPLSCKLGTQCRFKPNTPNRPFCYNTNNGGPWARGQWSLDIGEECTLDLYAGSGPCKISEQSYGTGIWSGYTCYNFGPLKPPLQAQVGICAHDMGPFTITKDVYGYQNGGFGWDPMFIPFVSPATTPLRGASLRNYYKKYVEEVEDLFLGIFGKPSIQSDYKNQSCNVAKTEEMLGHWKFFVSLEGTPPPGQDHVATEVELEDRLQKVVDLTVDRQKKICQVYKVYIGIYQIKGALRCVADQIFVDANGNDGRCEFVPDDEDVTLAFAKKLEGFRDYVVAIQNEVEKEDERHRVELIGRVELECDPKLGKPPGSEGAPPTKSGDNDVLEGGYCPPDRGCYRNYGDYLNIYDGNCNWKDGRGEQGLFRDCQWMDERRKFGKCEERKLNEKIKEELSKFSSSNGLGRGDPCDYDFEKRIRKGIKDGGTLDGNKYRILWQIENKGLGVCDRTRMLECIGKGICECLGGTSPRRVTFEGTQVMSEYCYQTSGDCKEDKLDAVYNAAECTKREKEDIEKHYRAKGGYGYNGDCDGSNWCVFATTRYRDLVCTTDNTGNTGFFPEVEPETEKPGPGGNKPRPPKCPDNDPYCDYIDAGKRGNQLHENLKIVLIIVMMISIKNYQ